MPVPTVSQDAPRTRPWLAALLATACLGAHAGDGTVPAVGGTVAAGYRPGEGYRVGNSGLALGGYATVEAESLDGERQYSEGGANLFVFYAPVASLRLFADLELPDGGIERAHLELSAGDGLNLRVGKLLTPFGRWNTAHIEPLIWTASEPLLVETIFDDSVSGAAVQGTLFPAAGALSYSVFGTLFDPINADADEAFADRLAGVHVEWASLDGWSIGASHLASRLDDGRWNHLGGADVLWQPHPRVELSAEVLSGRGSRGPDRVAAGYLQVAVETLPGLHAVLRHERVHPAPGADPVVLTDVGLAWVPRSYLRLKVDYLFANRAVEPAEPGWRAALSFLF